MQRRITFREATWPADATALSLIRREVFIEEQGVPEPLEFDGLDPAALHWLATGPDREPIATLRMLPSGQIGRMAVRKPWRGHGIGSRLLDCAMEAARRHGWREVWLNAQDTRIGFYARHDFFVISDTFEDAGIPHRRMLHRIHHPGPAYRPSCIATKAHQGIPAP
ncbi:MULTISPECIES: GNAT family N-acetyltransferase [unclassified Thioalkalivibrio]|uniref:GNAT family N-acetyltransferase n=1 Tax=unclassified Thioalkalivibrio TaxID=2621013 RepID=UPI00037DC5AA|nr:MULTISPECIES: GNAT family N-acetyltransferase [unclassified Thioalkalivibrio]